MKLIIKDVIPKDPPPKNQWELEVRAMSGDADHYETTSHMYEFKHELMEKLEVFSAFMALTWNQQCNEDTVFEAIARKAKEIGVDAKKAQEWYTDTVGYDVTCEGTLARLDHFQVFFYDEYGIKHSVDVLGDDGLPVKHSRYS